MKCFHMVTSKIKTTQKLKMTSKMKTNYNWIEYDPKYADHLKLIQFSAYSAVFSDESPTILEFDIEDQVLFDIYVTGDWWGKGRIEKEINYFWRIFCKGAPPPKPAFAENKFFFLKFFKKKMGLKIIYMLWNGFCIIWEIYLGIFWHLH